LGIAGGCGGLVIGGIPANMKRMGVVSVAG